MELVCGNYDVKLIPNPTDFILRLENRDNSRLFERTFFERDFAEYIVLGGLEFVVNLLKDSMKDVKITESPTQAAFTVSWGSQYSRTIDFKFTIPAIKRDKASGDLEEVTARMKKMEKAAAEQKAALDQMLVLYTKISANVTELEARCGDTITLPGCDYAISTGVTNLILVMNWGMLPDGRQFSTFYQDFYFQNNPGWSGYNPNSPFNHAQHGQNPPWSIVKNGEKAIIFNNLKSIKNLKYCKNLNSLTICGAHELRDYTLSDLKNLQTLNIIGNFEIQNPTYKIKDNHPQLTDISWISNLKNLQNVSFRGCTNLVNVGPIKDLPNLKELDLRDTGVKNTGFLASSTLKITV